MNVYIYTLIDPITRFPRYVGKTINIKRRLTAHCGDRRTTHKGCWVRSLSSLGLKPIFRTLEVIPNSNDADWQVRERFWIRCFQKLGFLLTNLEDGGRNGKRPSEETRKKISAARTGKKHTAAARAKIAAARTGTTRKMSKEQVLAHSQRLKGRKLSAAHCAKISEIQRGRKLTQEWRANIGLAGIGRKNSPETLLKMSCSAKRRWAAAKELL